MIVLFSAESVEASAWSVSFKAGTYQPRTVDYDYEYGHTGNVRTDLELDYKITPRLEAGVSIGYFRDSGPVRSASGRISAVSQELTLVPTALLLQYDFNFDESQLFVPYLGGGIARVTYRHVVGEGEAEVGGFNGYQLRTGIKFLLNRVEPDAASRLNREWGVTRSYLLLEGQFSSVNDFGGQGVDLGGWSYLAGIALEF